MEARVSAAFSSPRPWSPSPDASDIVKGIHAMLHPHNIVLVGATDKPGNYAERIWNNLVKYGFEGGLYPVNAKRETIWGVPCYKDFAALPEKPDHVLVLVPARFAVQVIRDAAAAGARSATIVTSGFSELQDDESQKLAAELQAAIRETGLAVTGPNCLGNLSAGEKLFTNIDDRIVTMEQGAVAIAGQSGAIVMAIRQALEDRGVGVGYMVTTGNEAGLETPDLMRYFAEDPSVKVIVVYLEGVRNTKAFRDACKAARAASKPVIALKLGASEGGRAAAMAHTGALAGSIETFDAIATREGVIRVGGLDELIETTECFVHAAVPNGDRLAAVTLSGGKRGMLIDAFYAEGLNFAPLSPHVSSELARMLGPGSIVGNPLDAGFAAVVDPSVYMKSIKLMIDDPEIDIVIIDAELPKAPHELRERNLRIVDEMASRASKPVIYISAMSIGFTEFTKSLRKSLPHLAVMQGMDRAVTAIKSLLAYAKLRKEVPDIVSSSKPAARAVLEKALTSANGAALDEVASKKLLKAYGIPTSKEATAQTAAEAVKIAKQIGFPVVAKVVSAEILHKSDIGGVVLNLSNAAEVRNADITARVKRLKGKPRLDGILIAQQVKADLELVVGASLDAEMGPVVLFGTGGIDIELMKDVALAGAPLDGTEARLLIGRTKAGIKMRGYRGKAALHEASAVKALVGLSNLIADAGDRIASIDINPFLINTRTGVAVDALIVLNNAAAKRAAGH
ncbi:acetate--CoA ligase family protein [Bradyrhizobium sp. YCK136]|uniref:Putative acetyl-CoA synthetase n=1 Tax=Bradyrhizobium diazoefficiens TaxID=1355477 RepID=A0A0E4BNE8_9BRAD|nr:acetate--CoA ligase family protein [Bradyrhizobium diazoefficiens]MBR0867477.1 acetate--CoA ligase family protein [Bradyrhizobium diazoefficiens]MBR0891984.1 acetate--CoA ligase family protein [Bradyrhizobium diazoefficiens]MBR0923720.1 acetate--CoA ligase family protein [Bradyrhizobium diazoefficiens]WLA65222.1 acetate--CoA ligase family protein [Bradyrhizobium diazoefficiens]BAR56621.1 putative acetyl-CoA synthetase [Bradyrhizobium diazoefficiens]